MYRTKIDAPSDNRANPDVGNSLVACVLAGAVAGLVLGYIGHLILTAIGY